VIDYDFGSEPEQPAPAPQAPASTPWKLVVYAMLRSRRLIVLGLLVGGLVGFVRAALQLNVYRSTGKLLVRSGVREAGTPETDVASVLGTARASPRERRWVREAHATADDRLRLARPSFWTPRGTTLRLGTLHRTLARRLVESYLARFRQNQMPAKYRRPGYLPRPSMISRASVSQQGRPTPGRLTARSLQARSSADFTMRTGG